MRQVTMVCVRVCVNVCNLYNVVQMYCITVLSCILGWQQFNSLAMEWRKFFGKSNWRTPTRNCIMYMHEINLCGNFSWCGFRRIELCRKMVSTVELFFEPCDKTILFSGTRFEFCIQSVHTDSLVSVYLFRKCFQAIHTQHLMLC